MRPLTLEAPRCAATEGESRHSTSFVNDDEAPFRIQIEEQGADTALASVDHAACVSCFLREWPHPDLAVIGNVDDAGVDAALSLVPEGRPAVVAELEGVARERAVARAERAGTPMLLGGRDHRIEDRSGRLAFIVRDEPYVAFDPPPGYAARDLATGIAAALALGVMGIRMREDWVIAGLASLGQPAAVT